MHTERSQPTHRITPQSGVSFALKQGEILRVTDPGGQQFADLFAFKQGDLGKH